MLQVAHSINPNCNAAAGGITNHRRTHASGYKKGQCTSSMGARGGREEQCRSRILGGFVVICGYSVQGPWIEMNDSNKTSTYSNTTLFTDYLYASRKIRYVVCNMEH